jgi:hypothetical protein
MANYILNALPFIPTDSLIFNFIWVIKDLKILVIYKKENCQPGKS